MDVERSESRLASVASAIADPARARILCCLLDGRARTATELAVVAQKSPSTASTHFQKLVEQGLVSVVSQGRHRYFQLTSSEVAKALEGLLSIASFDFPAFNPSTPCHLRHARTCYDHLAGEVGVMLHDALLDQQIVVAQDRDYILTEKGSDLLARIGVHLEEGGGARRRFAFPCLDWSQRCAHIGGTLGAALLTHMVRDQWFQHALDSRALTVTARGRKRLVSVFGIHLAGHDSGF